jgi:hypothetical protein
VRTVGGAVEPDREAGRTGETGRAGGCTSIAGCARRGLSVTCGCRVAGDSRLTCCLARCVAGRFTGGSRPGLSTIGCEASWSGASVDQDRRGRADDRSVRCRR